MSLFELVVLTIAAVGVLFMLISAVGILRLPDVFARMHAAGKAATLGVSCLLLSAGMFFGEGWFWRMAVLIVLFFVTAPISTTAMARAAYRAAPAGRFLLRYDEMAEGNDKVTG
ncbi:MAG: monovalent cation/H(+) antiporter subunit G [Caldilineaceae bacterium]